MGFWCCKQIAKFWGCFACPNSFHPPVESKISRSLLILFTIWTTIAFCNVVACLNESSGIRLLVLFREGNGMTCILYTVFISEWQLQYQTIMHQYCPYGLGDSWMAYTQCCYQNESLYHYQFRIVHEVWGTRERHIYTVLCRKQNQSSGIRL